MTTRIHGKKAAAEVATQDEDQIRHAESDFETVPEDLAAGAAELRQAGREADEEEARLHGEAADVVATARAEADRIISEGQARALPLVADAQALGRKAAELSNRSRRMEHAARQEELAVEHEGRAEDLTSGLGRLNETIAGLDGKLAALEADRAAAEADRATARSAGDVRTVASLASLVEAADEAMADLVGQRDRAQARAREIGQGIETEPGELLDALTAAGTHRAALTQALDELFPDRLGAELRRTLADFRSSLAANQARIAAEAELGPQQRQIVRL